MYRLCQVYQRHAERPRSSRLPSDQRAKYRAENAFQRIRQSSVRIDGDEEELMRRDDAREISRTAPRPFCSRYPRLIIADPIAKRLRAFFIVFQMSPIF